jgi:2-desacetyl-2-hydroxyethyl bacteriochlorophyllide A dehydrogenase
MEARTRSGVGQVVRFTSPGVAEVVSEDRPVLGPDEVMLETAYSGISAGTELTAYRGSNPYMSSQWDPERRLFRPGETTLAYPLDGWGYEEVGRVDAVGSSADADLVGRLAWGAWGHRSHAVRPSASVRDRLLPDDSSPLPGIFARIGAIALNAVLDADIHVGETVAVFGGGVPGQIVAQLVRLNGARVIVVDRMRPRLELAARLGAAEVLEPSAVDVSLAIRDLTEGRGADVVIEMSGAYQALQEAVRTAAYSSRVVVSGFFQGPGTPLRLGEEFHHNRISLVSSQISGVAPHLQHRWDELRMSTTILELERQGRLALTELVTHLVDAEEAPSAFTMLDTAPEEALQVVLDYGTWP